MNGPRAYNAGEPVYEGPVDHNIWIDGDNHLWIGSEADALCWDPEHGSPTRAEGLVSALHEANPAALKDALESAGVLPDAAADDSETGESGDVTPVTDVGDLCDGDRVTATDDIGTSDTGTLESVEVNLNPMNNPYHVEFSDGSRWNATHVEPAEDAEDESRSPEDVAETWVKATYRNSSKYGPAEALHTDTDRPHPFVLKPAYNGYGEPTFDDDSMGFGASGVTEVDADDLPFSEVPTDD